MKNNTALLFIIIALLALISGVFFGLFAALQYVLPEFLKASIPFHKMRPLHTTTVITWIVLAATGIIYFFITKIEKISLWSSKLHTIHLLLFLMTGVGIYVSYFFGKMEGREYLAFTPILTIPILVGWVMFGINYFKTLRGKKKNWPVYFWMWGTGIVFMIYHLCEANLWLIPSFRAHFIKDTMVQWKSYGSFVGSWNMLVYGIAIYVMSKIKKETSVARGKTVFFFYFLGLTNLMLGWAHHTYTLPTAPWVRLLSYAVSMTEWVVLAHIIYTWKKSLSNKERQIHTMAYKFLIAADLWVFLNIILALLLSIPSINFYTHGTHITVAHSMGTTVGINTSILLGAVFFVLSKFKNMPVSFSKYKLAYYLYNSTLFLFCCTLLYAGIQRSNWTYAEEGTPFSVMQNNLHLTYTIFFICGLGLVIAILLIAVPLLHQFIKITKTKPCLNN